MTSSWHLSHHLLHTSIGFLELELHSCLLLMLTRMIVAIAVLLAVLLPQMTSFRRMKSSTIVKQLSSKTSSHKLSMALLERDKLRVTGSEGLLDTSRIDKAFRGSGIKVDPSKKLKVSHIHTAYLRLAESSDDTCVSRLVSSDLVWRGWSPRWSLQKQDTKSRSSSRDDSMAVKSAHGLIKGTIISRWDCTFSLDATTTSLAL
jgi:hypothetical protein